VTRRDFAKRLFWVGAAAGVVCWLPAGEGPRRRAAIIGHTGQGNYGHGLELLFNHRPDVEVVAVADPDAEGRAGAALRSRARRQYADYREMLEKEKPDLVSVAPRCTNQHHAMSKAALETGAHVYSEKPFTQTLAEADDLIATARRLGRKIAVAHQMRLAPSIVFLKQKMDGGLIGDLLQIRARGKQDQRAGGEDMIVLGTHLFDLMRFFGGDPHWCSARILQGGREVTVADVHPATENIGPVVGDEIEAQFGFANGVFGSFTSRGKYQRAAGTWGLDLVGSRGVVRVIMSMVPKVYRRESGQESEEGWTEQWKRLEGDPGLGLPEEELSMEAANRRVVDDWLAALTENREPICSGEAAGKALEMVMGVFRAGLTKERVGLPLVERGHPLMFG
jgi:predicted dehydrogenase